MGGWGRAGGRSHTFDLGDGGKSVPTFSFPAAELPVVSHTTDIANITTFFPGGYGMERMGGGGRWGRWGAWERGLGVLYGME